MDDENKRIDIDDLPKAAEELTDDEEKAVTGGGILYAAFHVNDVIDGAKLTSGNTVGGALGAIGGNTVGGSLSIDPSNPNKR